MRSLSLDVLRVKSGSFFLFLAIFLPFAASRAFVLLDLKIVDQPYDYWNGYMSDLGVALLVTAVLRWIPHRAMKWVFAAFAILFAILSYSNVEYVKELDSNLNVLMAGFLKSEEFVKGSALQMSAPWFLISLLVLGIAAIVWGKPRPRQSFGIVTVIIAALAIASPHVFYQGEVRRWRQLNFLDENAAGLYRLASASFGAAFASASISEEENASFSVEPEVAKHLDAMFAPDLGGTPIFHRSEDKGKPNILMIIVESMPGAAVHAISGRKDSFEFMMPHVDRLAQQGIVYPNFFNPSRKTNRGEYALFCGDYPNVASYEAKMDLYSDAASPPPCLPDVLATLGYHSAYIQSAPLTFMNKNIFMSKAGFTEVFGRPWFHSFHAKNNWGVDDLALYEHTMEYLRVRAKTNQPWFVATLNVGTHHPGLAPEEWMASNGIEDRLQAGYAYADESLAWFIAQAQKEGLLDNTLVLITSDESRPARLQDEVNSRISRHWGSLVVLTPNRDRAVVNEPFHQTDIALSILDYINAEGVSSTPFVGRSIFRKYLEKRSIVFGFAHDSELWVFDGEKRVTGCERGLKNCATYTADDNRIFTAKYASQDNPDAQDIELMRAFVKANDKSESISNQKKLTQLVDQKIITVSDQMGSQEVLARPLGPIPSMWQARVRLRLRAVSGKVVVEIYNEQQCYDNLKNVVRTDFGNKTLKAGESIVVEYVTNSRTQQWRMIPTVEVRSLEGDSSVQFERADALLEPAPHLFTDGIVYKKLNVLEAEF